MAKKAPTTSKKTPQKSSAKDAVSPGPPSGPNQFETRALVTYAVLNALEKSNTLECDSNDVKRWLIEAQNEVTPTAITQQMTRLPEVITFLGARSESRRGVTRIWLDPAVSWYRQSDMFKRLLDNTSSKTTIAQLVFEKQIELIDSGTINRQPSVFYDAGSTCLAAANHVPWDRMSTWTIMSNNLFLILGFLARGHHKLRVPAGQPDQVTGAIVESSRANLELWFRESTPEMSVVSFHWVELQSGDEVHFCSEQPSEQTSKIAGMVAARQALFIPVDQSKLIDYPRSRRTVKLDLASGKWLNVESSAPMDFSAMKIFFCTDAPAGTLSITKEHTLSRLASIDHVEVLRPER